MALKSDVAFSDEELNLLLEELESQEKGSPLFSSSLILSSPKTDQNSARASHTSSKIKKKSIHFLLPCSFFFFLTLGFAIGWTLKKQSLMHSHQIEKQILLLIEDIRKSYESLQTDSNDPPSLLPDAMDTNPDEIIEPLFLSQDFSIA
jgi:hypothetical protein